MLLENIKMTFQGFKMYSDQFCGKSVKKKSKMTKKMEAHFLFSSRVKKQLNSVLNDK